MLSQCSDWFGLYFWIQWQFNLGHLYCIVLWDILQCIWSMLWDISYIMKYKFRSKNCVVYQIYTYCYKVCFIIYWVYWVIIRRIMCSYYNKDNMRQSINSQCTYIVHFTINLYCHIFIIVYLCDIDIYITFYRKIYIIYIYLYRHVLYHPATYGRTCFLTRPLYLT